MTLVLQKQGQYEMAPEWYQQTLAGREGADHPSTQVTIRNLENHYYRAHYMLEGAEQLRLRFPTAWSESEIHTEEE